MATLRPNWPVGLPSPQALQIATDAMCRQYVLAETMLHKVVIAQALELAYLLSAYGLVPQEPQPAALQTDSVEDTATKLLRTTRARNRRRSASRHVLVDMPSIR